MKKTASLLLVLLLLCSFVLPVSADILWEPFDNNYYTNNYDDCTTVARKYYVPEGSTVNFYKNPEGGALIATVEAGTRIYVGFSKEVNGEVWGVGYPLGQFETEGWFRLGRLQLEYDSELFMEEHRDAITAETVSFDGADLTGAIPTWTYPGSGIPDMVLDFDWEKITYNDGKLECRQVYTDETGGRWGYVGYYMGRCGWIYLDDLYTDTPPSFPQQVANTVTDTSPTEAAPGGAVPVWLWILIPGVVVCTAAGIVFLRKYHAS